MKTPFNRRQFLQRATASLGGVALTGLTPVWARAALTTPLVHRSTWTMGTLINLSVKQAEYRPARIDAAFAALTRVDRTLSAHQPTSDLSFLNAHPGTWLDAGPDLLQVARAARHYGDLTGGALDVTVRPVLQAYGFLPGRPADPDRLREHIDYTRLRLDAGRVRLDDGFSLDFGGIAKGYAVDEGVGTLRAAGVRAALLEAGGDIYAHGRPEPDRRWRIGIRDPRNPGALYARIEVEDEAIATSGLYAQSRTYRSETVSHLIDPVTGRAVNHVLSATVMAPTAMAADALVTATAVMPPPQAQALIASLPEAEALWLYANGTACATPGLQRRMTLL